MARDLTEQLWDQNPDALIAIAPGGAILHWNSAAETIFGYTRDEAMGQFMSDMIVPKDRSDDEFRVQSETLRKGLTVYESIRRRKGGALVHVSVSTKAIYQTDGSLDYFLSNKKDVTQLRLRKDGTEFPVEISLSPLETEEGLFVSSAIRDVTQRKRFEQTLRDKNLELENAALAKDRFLASMSHELRTPLNAIIGFTGTLLMKLPGPLNAEQDNDMLDLAKLGADKLELHLETVNCNSVVEEVASSLCPEAEKKDLAFTVRLPSCVATLRTDRRALSQIMINLTHNAIKFTEAGGVHLRLERSHASGRNLVRFSVLDAVARCKLEGTGLGLHLSRKLAEQLGGSIVLHSTDGGGGTFTLELSEG